MKCDRRLISFYRDGELPLDQRRVVDEHLSVCRDCSATLRGFVHVAQSIRSMPLLSTPLSVESGVRLRIAAYEQDRANHGFLGSFVRTVSPAVAAASVAIAVLIVFRPGAVEMPLRAPTVAAPVISAPPPVVVRAPGIVPATQIEPSTIASLGLGSSGAGQVPPSIKRLYDSSPGLREQLGQPAPGSKTVIIREQSFQGGVAIWRSDTHEIYVLNRAGGAWAVYPDTWKPGDRVAVGATPPPGAMAPEAGFGALWRSHPELQTRMGWAVYEPRGSGGAIQRFERGIIVWSPHGLLYVLHNDGAWKTYPDAKPI